MKEYLREREQRKRVSTICGLAVTVGIHAGAVLLCSFTGLKYLWPPPQEKALLIDFSDEEVEIEERGLRPRSEEPDKTVPEEIVQDSESPFVSDRENITPESVPDPKGDVETPAEPELNPNAMFPGMSKKDTSSIAPHSASRQADTFKAGQPNGNTSNGPTDGKPNAQLAGRSVEGAIPRPTYSSQEKGTVVVDIWVDQYGAVQKAVAGADGTTVTDKTLWKAAVDAAFKTHFKVKADAPALQKGTITYNFNLN